MENKGIIFISDDLVKVTADGQMATGMVNDGHVGAGRVEGDRKQVLGVGNGGAVGDEKQVHGGTNGDHNGGADGGEDDGDERLGENGGQAVGADEDEAVGVDRGTEVSLGRADGQVHVGVYGNESDQVDRGLSDGDDGGEGIPR